MDDVQNRTRGLQLLRRNSFSRSCEGQNDQEKEMISADASPNLKGSMSADASPNSNKHCDAKDNLGNSDAYDGNACPVSQVIAGNRCIQVGA